MASLDFIQKRIAGKQKELDTLNKKMERILKAKESNWEKNPYWYSERDLTSTQRDIDNAQKALQDYKDQLTAETEKANSRNIPVILEFLDRWKKRVFNYYTEMVEEYAIQKEEYYQKNSEYVKWSNNEGYTMWKENRDEYNRISKEYHEYEQAFRRQWNWLVEYIEISYTSETHIREYHLNGEKLNKVLDQEANAKYDFIIERTNAIVGQITDASNLRIGAKGELNGLIHGTKGTAKVETIGAGGWNIQIYHFRTLIHAVK